MYSLCTMLERSISRDDAIFSRYFQTKVNYKDKRAPGHQFDDSVRLIGRNIFFWPISEEVRTWISEDRINRF